MQPGIVFCGGKRKAADVTVPGQEAGVASMWVAREALSLDRSFRGGINHPIQSKKPEFHRLVFLAGKTIR